MEYHHETVAPVSLEECEAAVGKRGTVILTGTISSAGKSNAGGYVKLKIDERFGFGPLEMVLDLPLVELED